MNVIKRVYYNLKKENIAIFYTDAKDLKEFTTTEKDMKSGRSRFPPSNLLSTEEDLFAGAAVSKVATDDNTDFLENTESLVAANEMRVQQLKAGQNFSDSSTRESDKDFDEESKQGIDNA